MKREQYELLRIERDALSSYKNLPLAGQQRLDEIRKTLKDAHRAEHKERNKGQGFTFDFK
jgi:hypothetical protein